MIPIRGTIRMANGTPAEVIGGIPIVIGCNHGGAVRSYQQLAYVVIGISHLCLSNAVVHDMGMLPGAGNMGMRMVQDGHHQLHLGAWRRLTMRMKQ